MEQLMNSFVKVIKARTRQGWPVENTVFKLLDGPKKDKDGMYLVVDGASAGLRNGRTRLYIEDVAAYHPIDSDKADSIIRTESEQSVKGRTDAELATEIRETFDILEEMTKAVASNIVKGLVVSGPAGIGKSFTVENTLHKNLAFIGLIRDGEPQYELITGGMSPSMLYEKLWQYKNEGQVLVFDDSDGILYDEDALNILKAALDSKKTRKICWNTRSLHLQRNDIPTSFEYKGGIIFITNIDFNNVRSPRIKNHLEAIVSRCHYMELGIRSTREKLIHIKDTIDRYDMFHGYGFEPEEKAEVVKYVEVNVNKLREISLRTVIKVADLRRAMPTRWTKFADKNVLKAPA